MKLCKTPQSLKRTSKEVVDDATAFVEEFGEFCLRKKCMALAASQVGKFDRVVAVKNRSRKKVTVMVNPEIVKRSKFTATKPEGSASMDRTVQVPKERPLYVVVAYDLPDLSKRVRKAFWGRQAAAACHVIDMLDGILIK